jgi:hypothetical protein
MRTIAALESKSSAARVLASSVLPTPWAEEEEGALPALAF